MGNPWFRLYNEIIDDPKLLLLAFEDRWHFIALLSLKNQGELDTGSLELVRRKAAVKLGIDMRTLDEVARRLADVELIEQDTLQPLAWDHRQFVSDRSTDRVRAYRERKKRNETLQKPLPPVTVTAQDTETDTDSISLTRNTTGDFSPEKPAKKSPRQQIPFSKIVDLYHAKLPMCPRVEKLTDTRKGFLRQRWMEDLPSLGHWENFFEFVSESTFLTGKATPSNGKPPFLADLEWLTRPGNFAKVAEERYHRG